MQRGGNSVCSSSPDTNRVWRGSDGGSGDNGEGEGRAREGIWENARLVVVQQRAAAIRTYFPNLVVDHFGVGNGGGPPQRFRGWARRKAAQLSLRLVCFALFADGAHKPDIVHR